MGASFTPKPYPGWSVTPEAAVTLIEYRYPGQKGSHPHFAYIPGEVWCEDTARATLEKLTGPTAKLAIVGKVRRDRPDVLLPCNPPVPEFLPDLKPHKHPSVRSVANCKNCCSVEPIVSDGLCEVCEDLLRPPTAIHERRTAS